MSITKIHKLAFLACFGAAMATMVGCEKSEVDPAEVYPEAPKPLVKFLDGQPSPAIGGEGTIVTFRVSGLKGKNPNDFTFLINQTPAEVVETGEETVRVRIPANASTGGSAILINGEYYFGPSFTIRGKVIIDPSFNADAYRANGPINGVIPAPGGMVIYGSFTDYNNRATESAPITNLAILDGNGAYQASQFRMGRLGLNGPVYSVLRLSDGKYIVGGGFSRVDTISNINNMARFNADGSLDLSIVDVINPDPVADPTGDKATVSTFNAGVSGGGNITNIFFNGTYGLTTIGNFSNFVSTFYERSTKTGPFLDILRTRQMIRTTIEGAFDSTFNFNRSTKESFAGGNGFISDALQMSDGKIIVVGNFTTFHGRTVNYITRIDPVSGLVDETFNQGGSGADGEITKITFNAARNKILLAGTFKNFNGTPANGVVMINPDGTVDPSFRFRNTDGGVTTFAGQLNGGRVVVSGSFNSYDGIVRPGIVILEADGSLAFNCNTMGLFRGSITGMLESVSPTGVPQVTIVGNFDRFDGRQVGNIVKFRIEN